MNLKQLGILLVLVVVLGGAGIVVLNKQKTSRSSGNTAIGQKVLGDLPVNDVAHLRISHGTNQLNLVRKDDIWRVAERGDYPANFQQISEFLIKARDLKAIQVEEIGPSQLGRLQLAPGQGTNSPTLVEFLGSDRKALSTLALGKPHISNRKSSSPFGGDTGGWPDGRYLMAGTNSGKVALVSETFAQIEPKPEQWLSKDFLKVEKPRSIEVQFPEATNSWKLTRESESGEWKLVDAKDGEKLDTSKSSGVTYPFSSASFNDVEKGNQLVSGTNPPTMIKISTFDGFNYTVSVGARTNDTYPIAVEVSADLAKERQAGEDEKPEDKAKLDKEFSDRRQQLEAKLKQEQSFQNWTYLVSTWTVEPLLKNRSELLEEKAETKAEESESEAAAHDSTSDSDSQTGAASEHDHDHNHAH
mgnify:CR=1 FL=1